MPSCALSMSSQHVNRMRTGTKIGTARTKTTEVCLAPQDPGTTNAPVQDVALTHDGVLGLEQSPPLAQSHGSTHLPRIMLRHVDDLERFKNKTNSTQDSQCYGDEGCHSTQEDEFPACFISDALPKGKNASQWPFSFFFWGYRDASLG